jgi:hypothetical protein
VFAYDPLEQNGAEALAENVRFQVKGGTPLCDGTRFANDPTWTC